MLSGRITPAYNSDIIAEHAEVQHCPKFLFFIKKPQKHSSVNEKSSIFAQKFDYGRKNCIDTKV